MKSRRPKQTKRGMVLGVAWYREADWPRIKELFPDGDGLPALASRFHCGHQ